MISVENSGAKFVTDYLPPASILRKLAIGLSVAVLISEWCKVEYVGIREKLSCGVSWECVVR